MCKDAALFYDRRVEIKLAYSYVGRHFYVSCIDSFHQDVPPPLSHLFFLLSPPSLSEAESSISRSSRIHLIMAAFPHLLPLHPLNRSVSLYFSGCLIHLHMSHYLPLSQPTILSTFPTVLFLLYIILNFTSFLCDSFSGGVENSSSQSWPLTY